MAKRKPFSLEWKLAIARRHLLKKTLGSDSRDGIGVQFNRYYNRR